LQSYAISTRPIQGATQYSYSLPISALKSLS
jgi:hypothetical protein